MNCFSAKVISAKITWKINYKSEIYNWKFERGEIYAYKIQHSKRHRYDARRFELCWFVFIWFLFYSGVKLGNSLHFSKIEAFWFLQRDAHLNQYFSCCLHFYLKTEIISSSTTFLFLIKWMKRSSIYFTKNSLK